MKLLIIVLAVAYSALAQAPTVITGPLVNASGEASNCALLITPVRGAVPGASTATIAFQVVGGDLSGVTSGYAANSRLRLRRAPLTLYSGRYTARLGCIGQDGSGTYNWFVPIGGSFSIGNLNTRGGRYGRRLGEIVTSLGNTPGTVGQQ